MIDVNNINLNRLSWCIIPVNPDINVLKRSLQTIIALVVRVFTRIFTASEWYTNDYAKRVLKASISCSLDPIQKEKISQIAYQLGIAVPTSEKSSTLFDEDGHAIDPKDAELMRLLFHISGDAFGKNSQLNGISRLPPLNYLKGFLEGQKAKGGILPPKVNELIEMLETTSRIERGELSYEDAVKEAFAKKRPLIISGGWNGVPSGHSIIHKLEPKSETEADFYIYNLGDGAGEEGWQDGVKSKSTGAKVWKGIHKDKFNSDFFAILGEFRKTHLPTGESTEYGPADIYGALKEILEPREEAILPGQGMVYQHTGTCGWKSLMAFYHTWMLDNGSSVEDWRLMKLSIRKQIIMDVIERISKPVPACYNLVQKSYQQLCGNLIKLKESNTIDEEKLASHQKSLENVQEWLAQHRAKSRYTQNLAIPTSWSHKIEDLTALPKLENPSEIAASQTCLENSSSLVDDARNLSYTQGDVDSKLRAFSSSLQRGWEGGHDLSVNIATLEIVKNLPHELAFWQTLPVEKRKALIAMLDCIGDAFFRSCFLVPEAEKVQPERIYVMMKIAAIQEHLAKDILPSVNNYLLGSTWLTWACENRFFTTFNSKMYEEILSIVNSDKEYGSANIRNCCHFNKSIGDPDTYLYSHPPEKNYHLFEDLSAADPSFRNRLIQEFPEVGSNQLTNQQIQARTLASSALPQWMKAVRDTHYRLHYVLTGPICNPGTVGSRDSRLGAFTWSYKMKDYPDGKSSYYLHLSHVNQAVVQSHPEVQMIVCNETKRFFNLYRPLRAKPLQKVVDKILSLLSNSDFENIEKSTIVDDPRKDGVDLPREEYQELMHIGRLKGKQRWMMYPTLALEFFTKYPEKIADPDYQVLFRLFFSKQYLKLDSPFTKNLALFLSDKYSYYETLGNIQTAAFLLQQMRHFGDFDRSLPNPLNEIRLLLNRPGLKEGERSLLYAELMANLSQKEQLDQTEIEELMQATIQIKQHGIPQEWADPEQDQRCREVIELHKSAIRQSMVNNGIVNQQFLNAIAKSCCSHPIQSIWRMTSSSPLEFETTGGGSRFFYRPFEGVFLNRSTNEIPLPEAICRDSNFRQLFSGCTHAHSETPGVYFFNDLQGVPTRLTYSQNNLVIEQQVEGVWYRYVHRSEMEIEKKDALGETKITSSLGSRYLVNFYHHWMSDNKVLIRDPKSGRIEYTADITNSPNGNYVSQVKSSANGTLLKIPSSSLSCFEDPGYVEEWFSADKSLKSINLPRFGLSFENKDGMLASGEFPGFYLMPKGRIHFLGRFSHYLLLENEAGEKKVIIPNQKLISPEKLEPLKPAFDFEGEVGKGMANPQSYHLFAIDENGKLVGKDRIENLRIAEIQTASQQYGEAHRILKREADKLTLFSKQEQERLEAIVTQDDATGDQTPDALALRTFAGIQLLKNLSTYGKELDPKLLKTLSENYTQNLALHNKVTLPRLSRENELLLLRKLRDYKLLNSTAAMRLKELAPTEAASVSNDTEQETELTRSLSSLQSVLNYHSKDRKKGDDQRITRSRKQLADHFLYYFEMVTSEGKYEEKERLRKQLIFLKHSKNDEDKKLYHFYTALTKSPSSFSPIPTDSNAQYSWFQGVIRRAETLMVLPETPPLSEQNKVERPLPRSERPNPVTVHFEWPQHRSFIAKCANSMNVEVVSHLADQGLTDLDQLFNEAADPENVPLNRELNRLKEDIRYYQDQSTAKYSLNASGLEVIEAAAREGLDQELITHFEAGIVILANREHPDRAQRLLHELNKKQGKSRDLTLDDIILSFARQDTVSLQELNPALGEREINALYQKTAEYLLHATHQQQKRRVLRMVDSVKQAQDAGDPEAIEMLTQKLGEMLKERAYDPQSQLGCLAFEYFADIQMRKDQVEYLMELCGRGILNPEGYDLLNLIKEIIMGSGKSKVLMQLLALMLADGSNLSLLVVLESLFESISSLTQSSTGGAFGQKLKTLYFDRSVPFDPTRLKTILEEMKATIENRDCMISTSKSIGSIPLRFIEKVVPYLQSEQPKQDQTFPEPIQLMREILGVLKNKSKVLLDEADTILHMLLELCFSVGEYGAPAQVESETLNMIFSLLYQDAELKAIARLESDPNPNPNAPPLSEDLYNGKLQRPLAEKVLDKLKTFSFSNGDLNNKMQTFMQGLQQHEKDLLVDYLCQRQNQNEAQQFYDAIAIDEIKDVLALCGEEIAHLLPHTLTRNCDEKYGIDIAAYHEPFAIPYSAVNTPNRGSQFSSTLATMNYTDQAIAKKGVALIQVKEELRKLQAQALKQLAEMPLNDRDVKKTAAWRTFQAIKGNLDLAFLNMTENEIAALHRHVNHSLESKMAFSNNVIKPQIQVYQQKLSWNPQNMGSFFKKIKGFTGTLWNGASMHPNLKPAYAAGIDTKTLRLLWTHSRHEVQILNEGSQDSMIEQLAQRGFDGWIDSGGYFKEGSNGKIAKKMAQLHGKPVIYYNRKGEERITDGTRSCLLANSPWKDRECITFYDQSRTTGADVKQKDNAVGVFTVGKFLTTRDLEQGVWRFRQIDRSQRIKFAMMPEIAALIRQKLGMKADEQILFDHILLFAIHNQSEQQGRDAFSGLKKQIWNIPQQLFLDILMHERTTPAQAKEAQEVFHKLWIKQTTKSLRETYGVIPMMCETSKLMDEETKKCRQFLEDAFQALPWLHGQVQKDALQSNLAEVSQRRENLPRYRMAPERDDEQMMEVEQEQETERQMELENVQAHQTDNIVLGHRKSSGFIEADRPTVEMLNQTEGDCPRFPLPSCFELDPELREFASAFAGIKISQNVLEWTQGAKDVSQLKLLGNYRTPFHFAKVSRCGSQVTLITEQEAGHYKGVYNLTLGFLNADDRVTSEGLEKIVKLRFLNGESDYDAEQRKVLVRWIEQQGKDKMRRLFTRIARGYPQKASRFQGSTLQTLLNT